ncbi:MAG TPA: lipoprotein signal peptidase [Flavobacteriales bacterium]|nr:lipoprotein signal peptidase [Flavobacteriales bacterium]HIL66391.1 lipoprotein signal peptidase [Flavobacteriales bacterium]
MRKILLTSFILLVFDQILKFWVKTHMFLGQEYQIFDWFIIHFTENNGMAFGMEFGGELGKILLTVFRIIVVIVGIYYVKSIIKPQLSIGALIALGLIIGGAIGNIIDSIFYGVIFNDSYNSIATFFPDMGGYSSLLHGKVVDMFYFPLINSHYPNWLPFWGGDHFIFFRPVFNLADAGISVGIFMILLLYRKQFS